MNLLVIDDEPGLSQTITQFLQSHGHICETAATYQQVQEKTGFYAYVLTDLMLPDGNGLDLLNQLKQNHQETGAIISTPKPGPFLLTISPLA